MLKTRSLEDSSTLKSLAKRLAELDKLRELSDDKHDEAWVLVHALSDMEESFLRILQELIPQLLSDATDNEKTYDLLLDIGEELRHILYHIHDPRFYRYLDDPQT